VTVFAPDEYAARLDAVQSAMAERGWAALVVVEPANLYYLTGYDAWSFYTPQGLVVPATGLPHLFARAMDADGAHHTAYLDREHIHGYPEHYVQRPDVHPWEWITGRAVELGLLPTSEEEVGVELDGYYLSPRAYLSMQRGSGTARLVDCHELVNWVRLVKSPREQALLREAGTVTDAAMRAALDGLAAGRRQCDVVAEILAAQARGAGALGGDYPAIVPMLPTGETAGTPHLTWSDAVLVRGEATTVELAGVRHRYHVPLARTVALGRPPRRLVECAAAVAEGLDAALESFRPGASGHDVHAAFNAVIRRHGLSKESRVGYSVGIGYPPDWGERTVSLRAEDTTELVPGMAFHLILGMWMDRWGYETSESVLVVPGGVEPLTHVPQGLVVKE
jgi:ectoine hydrolase